MNDMYGIGAYSRQNYGIRNQRASYFGVMHMHVLRLGALKIPWVVTLYVMKWDKNEGRQLEREDPLRFPL